MNRTTFFETLKRGLSGLPAREVDEIVADYEAHFTEATAAGRTEEDTAARLGDPARLAKELRAEAGFRRWKSERSLGNFLAAVLALLGLATVDLVILLPALIWLAVMVLVISLVVVIVSLVGLGMLLSLIAWWHFADLSHALARGLTGAGLLSGSIGVGALLLLVLDGVVSLLGKYARLHYRLVTSPSDLA